MTSVAWLQIVDARIRFRGTRVSRFTELLAGFAPHLLQAADSLSQLSRRRGVYTAEWGGENATSIVTS